VEPLEVSAQVNDRVRQFVAHMTHDLRTPLTSILGASDLLLSGRVGEPDERHAKLLRIVGEGTQRMASLLSEISARFVAAEDDQ
jgi:signal transduction histidine kinase